MYALATAPGRAAVAVVRLSGQGVDAILTGLCGDLAPPRRASLRRLTGQDGRRLDDALVLWLPGPGSYTGEDCVELHLHGGRAVVEAVLADLAARGARPAEPGEFTRRAFQNGRLDLSQAEAVADLVDAETEAQRSQALEQLGGALARRYAAWRALLVEALAFLEAAIDFPDEDLPAAVAERARPPVERLRTELEAALADSARGERVRDGWRIAVIGAPNAGKSSLFNALVRREAAIVTEEPGTTRDVIEASLTLEGYRVVLADTAGVRETANRIEAEGVRRARAWADAAALRLWVIDASAADGSWKEALDLVRDGDVAVLNKSDRPLGWDRSAAEAWLRGRDVRVIETSTAADDGVQSLDALLRQRVVSALSGVDFPAVTRERHRLRLAEAHGHVARAARILDQAELAAEDLRLAGRALGRVAGRVDAEDILDVVFASFCIGK
ncbi:MAG: tRNA uridine-5-carboxymethylaminomethyl(34) synthesis GTPase MnmE [Caulobacteraceae bacterium]|nr:tRNA uridine-5-carboxymethylaminomethyl(34) synthesis GTPase MnmE [Caulobacteraceae bacterium]